MLRKGTLCLQEFQNSEPGSTKRCQDINLMLLLKGRLISKIDWVLKIDIA